MNQVLEYFTSDILTGLIGTTIVFGLIAYAVDTIILFLSEGE